MAFIQALMVNLAITEIWYMTEWAQFEELQWDRKCDNIVSLLYFLVLWALFAYIRYGK